MKTVKEKQKETFETLKKEFNYKNIMQAPRLVKIVLSSGVGSFKDKKKIDIVKDRLSKITGQKVSSKGAKKSIASFKVREGDPVGVVVTLRGARMQAFFDKLIHVVLPRVKDFRGIRTTSIDEMGNISIGIKEHIVFPETSDEDAKDIFGLAITIATTAKNKKEAEMYLRHIGLPLQQ